MAPDQVQSISWNGRLGSAAAKPGRYSFRLTAASADGAEARNSQTGDIGRDSFDLYDNIFPVRGRHDFGGAGAEFGAGRAGHMHQGQDVFAKCGTRMVAARGGRVKFKQYHAAAGHYIVIDGDGTDVDYVYMHLDQPSPFARATACTRARRSAPSATAATPRAATFISSSGARPAGTTAASRSTRCRRSPPGIAGPSLSA